MQPMDAAPARRRPRAWRIVGWALVLAWSAALIATGLTGIFAKAFL